MAPRDADAHAKKRAGMIRNLKAKTGRTLEEWVELVVEHGPQTNGERAAWLKSEHALGHFQARLVVSEARSVGG